jgi:hypothetical protein
MSYASKKYTFGTPVLRSKEQQAAEFAAENARIDAEWKRYEANRPWLDKLAEGERASHAARLKEAQAKEAAKKYPFQGSTFDSMSYTFQPQLASHSWALEERERRKMQQEDEQ